MLVMLMNIYHTTHSPSLRTACFYFWGCNFKCKACIRRKETKDIHLSQVDLERETPREFLNISEVLKIIEGLSPKKIFFLGGEPTLDESFSGLCETLKKKFSTYHVLLTNGYIFPETAWLDEVQVSIKAMDEELHREFTGQSNRGVLRNFRKYYKSGVKLRAESIFIPGYIDSKEINRIAEFVSGVDPDIPYRIDAYVPVPGAPWRRPRAAEVEYIMKIAENYLNSVTSLKGDEECLCEVVEII